MDLELLQNNNLQEKLAAEYPHILKSIKREGYTLDYLYFDVFHEIKFKDEVVGFITTSNFDAVDNYFAIDEAYIIPEYRGNDLLFKYLNNLFLFDNYRFFARRPTKAFINVLLKNDYAFEVSPGFVLSYLKFIVNMEDIYKNPKIKKFYKDADYDMPYKANLFDMDLCSVMLRDPECNFIKYSDFLALILPRTYDLKKYKCRKKLKKVTERYLDEKYHIRVNTNHEINKFIARKDNEFDELLNVENMLGTEDELCEGFLSDLELSNLSVDDGFRIRRHIVNGLNSGQLTKTSYLQRLMYLLSNIDAVDWDIDGVDDTVESCPFCKMRIPDFFNSCPICGLSIRNIDFEEAAIEKSINAMGDLENLYDEMPQ